jgi:hypothetical protein
MVETGPAGRVDFPVEAEHDCTVAGPLFVPGQPGGRLARYPGRRLGWRSSRQAVRHLTETLAEDGRGIYIRGHGGDQPAGNFPQFDVLTLGLPAQKGKCRLGIQPVNQHERTFSLLDDGPRGNCVS